MDVLCFASRKGGSGKSTLVAHLSAHASRPSRRCLLVDADSQGSLTLWHKLRGTGEPALKNGARGVADVVEAARRDGYDWVFIDTPPDMSAVVTEAIQAATLVIVPTRLAVFDLAAIKETYDACLFLGDLVDYATDPIPCIDWVREKAAAAVRGNHDHGVAQFVHVQGKTGFKYLTGVTREITQERITPEERRYLGSLPI